MTAPFATHERDLFVIEQQGKRRQLARLLVEAGVRGFEIQPTYGLLFDLPEDEIGLHPHSLLATGYEVKRKQVIARLQQLAANATRIIVMTDADREGELIAAQVRKILPGKALIRLRLRALTAAGLKEALLTPGDLDMASAAASSARRIVDRIIGYGFSTPSLPRRTGIVGRVLTAALSAFDRHAVTCGEWSGKLGRFEARGVITNHCLDDSRRLEIFLRHSGHEIARLPTEPVRRRIAPPPPCNCADAILEGRRRLRITIGTGEQLLQARYEEGALSYLRSDSTQIGPQARSLALQMARTCRLTLATDSDQLYRRTDAVGRKHAHEALHPTQAVDLELEPNAQEKSDGLLTLIARRLTMALAAPIEVESERIIPAALRQLLTDRLGPSAAWLHFELIRDFIPPTGWLRWIKRAQRQSLPQVELLGAEATALSFIAGAGLGKPSNQVRFATALLDHGFIDDCGNVTALGQQSLDYVRERVPFLLDPRCIQRFEQVLDRNENDSVRELVVQLCDVLGLPVELAQSAVADWHRTHTPQPPAAVPQQRFAPQRSNDHAAG